MFCDNLDVVTIWRSGTCKKQRYHETTEVIIFHLYLPQHKFVHKAYTWTLQYTGRSSFSFTGGAVSSLPWRSRQPTIYHTRHDLGHLRHQLNSILNASIASSARKAYTTGTNQYLHFCNQIGHPPFPLKQETLMLFVFPPQPHIIQDYESLFSWHSVVSK